MGHLTELSLAEEGVVFTRIGPGEYRPFGPASRDDLRDALRIELDRRSALFVGVFGKTFPVIGEPTGARAGECMLCGDPMPPHVGGQCVLCTIALGRARKLGIQAAPVQEPKPELKKTAPIVAGEPLVLSAPTEKRRRAR